MENADKEHALHLVEKEQLRITGVKSVDTYDDQVITLETHRGGMIIRGEELHILHLDLEEEVLLVEGTVNEMLYADSKADRGKNFLKRLLR